MHRPRSFVTGGAPVQLRATTHALPYAHAWAKAEANATTASRRESRTSTTERGGTTAPHAGPGCARRTHARCSCAGRVVATRTAVEAHATSHRSRSCSTHRVLFGVEPLPTRDRGSATEGARHCVTERVSDHQPVALHRDEGPYRLQQTLAGVGSHAVVTRAREERRTTARR